MLQCCSWAPAKAVTHRLLSQPAGHRLRKGLDAPKVHPCSHSTVRAAAASPGNEPDGSLTNREAAFLTLAKPHTVTIEVKKSKFITTAWPTKSPEEALERVADAKDLAASHNCFAYKIGDQSRIWDDGEPRGTAGSPILTAIGGEGFDHVVVLVTRHFGGTKLGPGGLVRAYGSAARECLRAAEQCTVLPHRQLNLEVPLGDIGIAYGQISRVAAEQMEEQYSDDGQTVRLMVSVQTAHAHDLETALADISSGRISVTGASKQTAS